MYPLALIQEVSTRLVPTCLHCAWHAIYATTLLFRDLMRMLKVQSSEQGGCREPLQYGLRISTDDSHGSKGAF
uniref:Secreted protein n=1 Tax=Mesocestoides corti TaxID=53468 RepID=A0A5K3FUI6_MESCO